jgi:hypothetical protein
MSKPTLTTLVSFALLIIANSVAMAKTTQQMQQDGDLLILFVVAVLGGALLLGNVLILAISATEKGKKHNPTPDRKYKKSRRRIKPAKVNYKMPQPAPNYAMKRRTNQNIAY